MNAVVVGRRSRRSSSRVVSSNVRIGRNVYGGECSDLNDKQSDEMVAQQCGITVEVKGNVWL